MKSTGLFKYAGALFFSELGKRKLLNLRKLATYPR
jgi:hypothetical protein